jgi:hypothetical protein
MLIFFYLVDGIEWRGRGMAAARRLIVKRFSAAVKQSGRARARRRFAKHRIVAAVLALSGPLAVLALMPRREAATNPPCGDRSFIRSSSKISHIAPAYSSRTLQAVRLET